MADYGIGGTTLKEVSNALTGEGLGVAIGLLGAGFAGRTVQNYFITDAQVTAAPTITNYAKAWLGNNGIKLGIWYYLRDRARSEITIDAKKAVAGSVVFDTIMRGFNGGTNPATATVGGYEVLGNGGRGVHSAGSSGDVQRLIQENSGLRNELNKALQRLADEGIALDERTRKKYAQMGMDEALQTPRQKKFAFAGESTGMADLTARFGML
jgi:hypothetical protein